MLTSILRKEHKNNWERRAALTPQATKKLAQQGYVFDVESSPVRIYTDEQYQSQGCHLVSTPENYQFVLGIKEPPVDSIQPNQVHLAFSHTMKGQSYNMPLLQKFIDQKATLIDYELITNDEGLRTIAFGRYAGIAGAIYTLHFAGKKYQLLEQTNQLHLVRKSWQYGDVETAENALQNIDLSNGQPVRILIVGTGKVGKGAEEVCQWIGLEKLPTEKMLQGDIPDSSFYAVVSSRHIHQHIENKPFDYADYLENGKNAYQSTFHELLGRFDILLQTPYWDAKYPKLLPLAVMRENIDKLPLIVGDISCDIDGSLACTKIATDIDNPVISYDALSDSYVDGLSKEGVAVMSIDNLPCELSLDATNHFSAILPEYVTSIMDMDLSSDWENLNLPEILKRAVIVYNGQLTPKFQHLQKHLQKYLQKLL